MDGNDALFYTSLYTFMGGFLLAITGLLYKSKCKHVECCGCIIDRDVEIELKDNQMEKGQPEIVD